MVVSGGTDEPCIDIEENGDLNFSPTDGVEFMLLKVKYKRHLLVRIHLRFNIIVCSLQGDQKSCLGSE